LEGKEGKKDQHSQQFDCNPMPHPMQPMMVHWEHNFSLVVAPVIACQAERLFLEGKAERPALGSNARSGGPFRGRRGSAAGSVAASLPSAYVPRTKVDAAGTSNSPNGRLTRQKLSLFQWLVLPQWFPTDKDSAPTDSGIPFECFLNPADRLEPGARSVNS
jgi:hypothetical protein